MWAEMQIYEAYRDGKNILWHGDMTLNSDLVIPEGIIFQVDGDLDENGHSITGAGTFRVTGDYTVDNNGANREITVPTQVGGDLLLGDNTTTKARVGVYGDIIGGTANLGDDVHSSYTKSLTVETSSSVFARGDVEVNALTVKGHLEATDIHAENGISVLSDNTLIASGSVLVCNGNLQIGEGSEAGIVTIAGSLTIDNGNLIVENGTLNLARGSKVIVDGNVSVGVVGGTTGNIKQTGGITANMDVDGTVTINKGTVSIPGTIINATSVKVEKDGVLTVTVKPDNYDESSTGTLNEGGTGSTDEPDVVYDLQLTSLEIKGQPVSLNQSDKTGSVTLTDSQAKADDVPFWAAKYSMDDPEVSFKEGSSDILSTSDDIISDGDVFTIRLTKEGARTITYNVKVTVLDPSDDATIGSIVVKGVPAVRDTSANEGIGDGSQNNAIGYSVNLTYDEANSTKAQLVITQGDTNATVTFTDTSNSSGIKGTGDTYKNKVTEGSFWFQIEAEDGTILRYMVEVTVDDQIPQDAKVELELAASKLGVAILSGNPTDGYVITTPEKVTSDWKGYLTIAENSVTATKTMPNADEGYTDTERSWTFAGIGTGDSQTIKVTFKVADDATKVAEDKALIEAGLAAGLAAHNPSDPKRVTETVVQEAIEDRINAMVKWGSTVDVSFSNGPETWNPANPGGSTNYTVDVTITLTSGTGTDKATETVPATTVTIRVNTPTT